MCGKFIGTAAFQVRSVSGGVLGRMGGNPGRWTFGSPVGRAVGCPVGIPVRGADGGVIVVLAPGEPAVWSGG